MEHELEVLATPEEVTWSGAALLARWSRAAVAAQGSCSVAVSGGHTPAAMFEAWTREDVPWERLTIYQVDERVAPDAGPDRNLTHLLRALGNTRVRVVPMPVQDPDLEAAAAGYARALPSQLDIIHLGLGTDGHTASLVPGDRVLQVTDRYVALTDGLYQGTRRMTFTYPTLASARQLLWVIVGEEKRAAMARMLEGDRAVPAGRVEAPRSLVLADAAAAGAPVRRRAGAGFPR
jgi:6-phosphogluconolactonase